MIMKRWRPPAIYIYRAFKVMSPILRPSSTWTSCSFTAESDEPIHVLPAGTIYHTYSSGLSPNLPNWIGVIEAISKYRLWWRMWEKHIPWWCNLAGNFSFRADDKLRQVASPLIEQVPISINLNSFEAKLTLQTCLDALVESATDDMILKAVNLELLMHTRSEDVRLRLFGLSCSEKLWRAHHWWQASWWAYQYRYLHRTIIDSLRISQALQLRLRLSLRNVAKMKMMW